MMQEVSFLLVSIIIPVVAIVGGCTLVGLAIYRQTRLKELAYRERIAMIERGLVPSPESDPAAFDRIFHKPSGPEARRRAMRFRSMGVLLMGIGVGLMMIIGLAGEEPGAAVGVGGAVVVVGLAFFINGLLDAGGSNAPDPHREPARSSPVEPGQGT